MKSHLKKKSHRATRSESEGIRNQVSNLSAIWSSEQRAWTWVFQVLDFQSWFLKFTQQNKEHLATKPWQKRWHYKGSKEQALPLCQNQTFLAFSEIPDLAVVRCWAEWIISAPCPFSEIPDLAIVRCWAEGIMPIPLSHFTILRPTSYQYLCSPPKQLVSRRLSNLSKDP